MRILITGSTGMVGRNLKERLSALGEHELLTPTRRELDLMSYQSTCGYFASAKADFVIHCAGLVGGIQANIARPTDFLVQNLEVGKNVVMAAKAANIPRLLNLGSSCMYPRDMDGSLKETDLLTGALEPTNEGYAIAKIAISKLCEYVTREFSSLDYKTIIPCNLYGPWDKFDPKSSHMIPSIILKMHEAKTNGKPIEIWGDGSARREFMHVYDLVNFVIYSLNSFEKIPSLLNVGLGHDYTVLEYYQIAAKVTGVEPNFVFDKTKPVGMKRKLLDVSLATALGWRYQMTLEEGLKNIYEHYQKVIHD